MPYAAHQNDETSHREIVRQQYNFSPPDTTTEREDYSVDLDSVTNLELLIIPDISGGHARARFTQLRIGSNTTTPNERSN